LKASLLALVIATVSGSYSSGDNVGVPVEVPLGISSGQAVLLESLVVIDKDKQSKAVDLVFFDHEPVLLLGDNQPLHMASDEALHILGSVSVAAADYKVASDQSFATKPNLQLMLRAVKDRSSSPDAKSVWVQAVAREAVTYPGNALGVRLGVQQ